MAREIDLRDYSVSRMDPSREADLNSVASTLSDQLPGSHRIRISQFDVNTGNPAVVTSEFAPAERGNFVQRAMEHVHGISRALGLTATQSTEFVADPDYQKTSSGGVSVHLKQTYKGIPVFDAAETVCFKPDGSLKETVGSSITIAGEVDVSVNLSVEDAVLKAAELVAIPDQDEQNATDEFGEPLSPPSIDLSGFKPKVTAVFGEKPERPTVLDAGPFGDVIKASLIWFPLDNALRLSWEVIITFPEYAGQFRTLVAADSGEILYCRQLMQFITARGNVFHVDGGSARQLTDFPRPLTDYGLPIADGLPDVFPDHWVTDNMTVGNNVDAHLGINGSSVQGTVQGGTLTFDPASSTGDDQKVLNIFYYNCFMHDYFYLLGFSEADGNFQRNNFGRGGLATDRVDARAHSGAVEGTANMATPMDGVNPIMNMGLVTSTGRHTAFDSTVVFHEFSHGVTNRLVGGPADDRALEAHQSGGMGEGWSDYFACTINDAIVVGDWVVNDTAGIRGFPYNSNFPDNFGDLGTGRYSGFVPDGSRRWPHPIGEIWCATLLEMNRIIGANLGAQLVVDALKLTPANPSFLTTRNSILAALDDMLSAAQITGGEHQTARTGIWQAFARFGMGPNAQSNGASLSGIVADFTVPLDQPDQPEVDVEVETSPNLTIPDNQPAGVASVLNVSQTGRIARLTVFVEIPHTYIGDLRVTLITPTGSEAVLHNRSGGSANDLIASYRSEDLSALNGLLGEQAQGGWVLRVVDLAGRDVGALQRWGLAMDLEAASGTVHGEAAPGIAIPDNNPNGISSSIAIAQSGTAQGLTASVDITHTYIGDLLVELVSPSGQRARLHDQIGRGQDNLIRSYDSITSPSLAALIGEPIQGSWVLEVSDRLGQDVGKLNRWSLDLNL